MRFSKLGLRVLGGYTREFDACLQGTSDPGAKAGTPVSRTDPKP